MGRVSDYLESRGWKFYQYGPEEWGWFLFDDAGNQIATDNDDIYWKTLKEIK